ncbi:SUMF1/EgtB/PvdO family nonheme iron enzyme [Svornostia abyssi]|uniref:SUMF1/EgtB/PvdO family nonheme iron enzyme n=1 Tax=Svornostia abyssi TaxID=2898438 RepID=A0ABY5PLI3_9ACTN|nr:SUMF1/EgtB/PvdO family nonheme iron enzyme [Parviterribacteraceae bacterium J379]
MQTLTAPRTTDTAARLTAARIRTLDLIDGLDDSTLERVHSRLMSPLVWDLGHIAAFADLWLSRQPGAPPPLRPELFGLYDAAETPRADRGTLPMLRPAAARAYLDATLDRALAAVPDAEDDLVFHLIAEHEEQHTETMLQCLQLAGIGAPVLLRPAGQGPRTVRISAGRHLIGATEGFSYDNERAAHERELPAFAIDRAPVTNGEWRAFIADGGYQDARWWTAAGWAWRATEDVQRPLFWIDDTATARVFADIVALDDDAPVMHVCAHEADAFARWSGARLPTEFEWEAAAAAGVLDGAGQVWEWTSSTFSAYPGFVAHPYREYSAIFFDGGYRVLRGGSWASSEATHRRTFRNWDHPQRRQIFAGVRLATEEDR